MSRGGERSQRVSQDAGGTAGAHAHFAHLSAAGDAALPTIISRCLRLDLGFEDIDAGAEHEPAWISAWYAKHPKRSLRGLRPAQVFSDHWASIRETAEAHLKELPDETDEDVAKALVEAEFQLGRQESIAQLQRWYWRRSEQVAQTSELERMRAVKALEELQAALAQNCEPNLAVEVACLRIEGLV